MTEYVKTLTIVKAIEYAAGVIATAGSGEPPSTDGVNGLLGELKDLLLPEMAEDREDKAKKVKRIMEHEMAQGPFKVESMAHEGRNKKGFN